MSSRKSIRQTQRHGRPAAQQPPLDPKLEKLAGEAEAQMEAQQRAQREEESRAQLEAAKVRSERVRAALAQEESSRQGRTGPLQKDLPPREAAPENEGFLKRLRLGIAKTRETLSGGLTRLVLGRDPAGPALLQGLEDLLLSADVGPQTVARLLGGLKERLRRGDLTDPALLNSALKEEVLRVLERPFPPPRLSTKPAVILFVGVNGSGKTTTVGKLGAVFKAEGKKVLLAAGDTFRAAAAEQLEGWARRSGCDLFSKPAGSDPAALVYQAVQKGIAEGYERVLCDTAGRLHTKVPLMEELKKVKRVLAKLIPDAPHETWLVLDANNGQNAVRQARDFHAAVGVTGLVVTKLDGTARAGVLIGIVNEFELPVRYIGVGEAVEDLRPFDARQYVASLLD